MLTARGATVHELPALAIEPPSEWRQVDQALRHLDGYHWVVFTSRNAVRGLTDRARQLDVDLIRPITSHADDRLQVAAVGRATAAVLEEQGIAVACLPKTATGKALATALAARGLTGKRVLVPQGNLARGEVREALEATGATVDEVIVYRSVLPKIADVRTLDALATGQIDTVVLASPSALHNLVALAGGSPTSLGGASLACIGPTTAAAVRQIGLEPACIARRPTTEALVAAIVETRKDGV
jgi:uroporphyrinogen-III synthase